MDKKKYDDQYKKECRVVVYVSPDIKSKIERLAERTARSISFTTASLIEKGMTKNDSKTQG